MVMCFVTVLRLLCQVSDVCTMYYVQSLRSCSTFVTGVRVMFGALRAVRTPSRRKRVFWKAVAAFWICSVIQGSTAGVSFSATSHSRGYSGTAVEPYVATSAQRLGRACLHRHRRWALCCVKFCTVGAFSDGHSGTAVELNVTTSAHQLGNTLVEAAQPLVLILLRRHSRSLSVTPAAQQLCLTWPQRHSRLALGGHSGTAVWPYVHTAAQPSGMFVSTPAHPMCFKQCDSGLINAYVCVFSPSLFLSAGCMITIAPKLAMEDDMSLKCSICHSAMHAHEELCWFSGTELLK